MQISHCSSAASWQRMANAELKHKGKKNNPTSCYAETTKDTFVAATGTSLA